MILIISSQDDISTNDVIDWLLYFQQDFLRISAGDSVKILDYTIYDNGKEDALLEIKGDSYLISQISSIWYRRSWITFDEIKVDFDNKMVAKVFNNQLADEYSHLKKQVEILLNSKMLNSQKDNYLSKIEILSIAKKVGLKIPNTIITRSRSTLIRFVQEHKNGIITKNYSPGIFLKFQDFLIGGYTTMVTENEIENLPAEFMPMLFQELIEKSFELRIFYLNGDFYSSAIFSQNDEKTKIDFRNYNDEKPNRTPPFNLPNEMKYKLTNLMNLLELNSGSIDLLVDKHGEMVFLEINPIGQFAQVSNPCNYRIEKKIAESLINSSHEKRSNKIN